jgi:uncharacterized membrane protein
MMKPNILNRKILIIIILLISVFLRFYKLELRSLWYDEACRLSYALSQSTFSEAFLTLVLKAWIYFFGISVFSLRSLGVILSILSTLFIYFLGCELFSESVGILSGLIFALSPFQICYSQQICDYNLLVLLVSISMLIFVKIIKKPERMMYLLYALVNILISCWFHMFSLLVSLVNNIYLLLFYKKIFFERKWLFIQILIFIFTLPICYFIFATGLAANELNWMSKPNIADLIDTLKAFTYGGEKLIQGGTGYKVDEKLLSLAQLLLFICPLLLIKSLFHINAYRKTYSNAYFSLKNKIIFLFIWSIFPILFVFFFSLIFFPVYLVRYFLIILPAYCLLLSIGILSFRNTTVKFIIISLFILLISQALWVYYNPQDVASWREISAYVRKNITKGDILLFLPLKQFMPFTYYFSNNREQAFKDIDIREKKIYGNLKEISEKEGLLFAGVDLGESPHRIFYNNLFSIYEKRARKIFLIASPYWPGIDESVPAARKYFQEQGWLEQHREYVYPGVIVYTYKK